MFTQQRACLSVRVVECAILPNKHLAVLWVEARSQGVKDDEGISIQAYETSRDARQKTTLGLVDG